MSKLNGFMENRRGVFQAYFADTDLGELAGAPEIKADYETKNFIVPDEVCLSRTIEGAPEIQAVIKLPLKSIQRSLSLLSEMPDSTGELRLTNRMSTGGLTLRFPCSRLLPVWEFAPSQTGDHRITVRFSALQDADGKLFYC